MLAGVIYFPVLAQQKNGAQNAVETKDGSISHAPNGIVRNIIQDRKGNIWIASWEGIFKYDGKSFTNITGKVSSARFFSALEDRKGNLWFGSIGSGVYYYNGKSFRNFTTRDGLLNNDVTCIYEDKAGNIWFGTEYGASRYDGKSFRNLKINGGINSIIEDKTGRFWFATTGNTFLYDGKKFTVFTHKDKPFDNVRSIIEDKKGNVWLGGTDGLWCYNGSTFTNFTHRFVSYIYEDKKGNIWTNSERDNSQAWASPERDNNQVWASSERNNSYAWVLSRYNGKSLSNKKPTITEITNKGAFGILEDNKGSIWFGTGDGVYRYDGITITGFKGKEGQK